MNNPIIINLLSLIMMGPVYAAPGINGGGIWTTEPRASPIPDAEFEGFVMAPMCTSRASGGVHKLNTYLSEGLDKLSFTFGTVSHNSEVGYINETGDMSLIGSITTNSVNAAIFKFTQVSTLPTCDANSLGTVLLYRNNNANHTSICGCELTGLVPTYAWNGFSTLGDCS